MQTDSKGYYYITVEFQRPYDEDAGYLRERMNANPGMSENEAAVEQFAAELQEGYDAAGISGFFHVAGEPYAIPNSPEFAE